MPHLKKAPCARSALCAVIGLLGQPVAHADVYQTYDLAWSGATFDNSATATGAITLDLTALEANNTISLANVSALTVVVSGAGAGNGAFTLADFDDLVFSVDNDTLNYSENLVGQTVGDTTWGSADSGDFNLFSGNGQPNAPEGYNFFTLSTDRAFNDDSLEMLLTEFEPAVAATDIAGAGSTFNASDLGISVNPAFTGGTLVMDQAGAEYAQNFTLDGTATNTIDQDGHDTAFTGVFSDATSGTPGNITIANSGSGGAVTFEGINTYTGTTTINAGAGWRRQHCRFLADHRQRYLRCFPFRGHLCGEHHQLDGQRQRRSGIE